MRELFEDANGKISMNRVLAFGCYVSGSVIGLLSVFVTMPEGVVAGTILAAVGAGTKALQKKYEK